MPERPTPAALRSVIELHAEVAGLEGADPHELHLTMTLERPGEINADVDDTDEQWCEVVEEAVAQWLEQGCSFPRVRRPLGPAAAPPTALAAVIDRPMRRPQRWYQPSGVTAVPSKQLLAVAAEEIRPRERAWRASRTRDRVPLVHPDAPERHRASGIGHRAPRTRAPFRYVNQFMDAERKGLDVLIADDARMAAGYCWPWSDPRKDGSLVPDVQIGDWSRPWNLKGDRSVGDAPPAALWASDDRGFGQVGCVYTAQGFEYAWNGVLLGPDLVWRDDRLVAVRKANRDPDFRNTKTVSDADVDALVRNVYYKVLLTRGLRGVYLHSTDAETQRFLDQLIN